MFCKEGVLKSFPKFKRKHLHWSFFLKKLQVVSATLREKRLQHRYFPVNFAQILRTPFSKNYYGRLLLYVLHTDNQWKHETIIRLFCSFMIKSIETTYSVHKHFIIELTKKTTGRSYRWGHGTIIRAGITCKKMPCYMRDSACSWFIVNIIK